ncbi:uncharacterized protein VTP21DRAFT_2003 [Calcarisporiella thermophila]|uniref:uncharacterized protein n=1 Tax=Calcarisporiella thermophila TaxID=911321 RepID=UPI0037448FDE
MTRRTSMLGCGMTFRSLATVFILFIILLTTATHVLAGPVLVARQQQPTEASEPGVTFKDVYGNERTIPVQAILLACFLLLIGIYFTFFGYRTIRFTVFLGGAIFFGLITWIGLYNGQPASGYGTHAPTIFFVVSIGVGLICGAILACCWRLGVWLLGALAFWVLGLWILSWRADGVIHVYWGRILFLTLMALLGFIIAIFFDRFIVIVSTSIIGAFCFFFGLDIFLNTGFANATILFLNNRYFVTYSGNSAALGMLGGTAALAILGIVVQYLYSRRYPVEVPAETTRKKRFFIF